MKIKQTASDIPPSTSTKAKYRIFNWPEYERALVKRGDITVWFDEEFIRCHWRPEPDGWRGAPMKYSDQATQTYPLCRAEQMQFASIRLPYRLRHNFPIDAQEIQKTLLENPLLIYL